MSTKRNRSVSKLMKKTTDDLINLKNSDIVDNFQRVPGTRSTDKSSVDLDLSNNDPKIAAKEVLIKTESGIHRFIPNDKDLFHPIGARMKEIKGRIHSYNGKKIQTGPRALIFGYVIDLPKCYNF